MTFRQWLKHLRQWWFGVLQFPIGRDSDHFWVGTTGEREEDCLICGAKGTDRSLTDEELDREKGWQKKWEGVMSDIMEDHEEQGEN